MEEQHEDHGHSVAAWAAVGIMLVGAAIGSIAVVMPSMVLGIIAAVVIVVGAIVGKVLAMAGYGSKPHDSEARASSGTLRTSGAPRPSARAESCADGSRRDHRRRSRGSRGSSRRHALVRSRLGPRCGAADRPAAVLPHGPRRRRHCGGETPQPEQGLPGRDPRAGRLATAYDAGGASAVSVLTESAGSVAASPISTRSAPPCEFPVLRKDFMVDAVPGRGARPWRRPHPAHRRLARRHPAAGPVRPGHRPRDDALIEVHDAEELERALALAPRSSGSTRATSRPSRWTRWS